jgi:hypothetical protein
MVKKTTKKSRAKKDHRSCGEPLHYKQIMGMRLYTVENGKRVYDAWCPKCKVFTKMSS